MPDQASGRTMKLGSRSHESGEPWETQGKPLLLVDVDGVISLWGFPMDRRPGGAFVAVDGLPHFLSHEAGRHLHALSHAFDLVWCTGWEEKADEYLPGALGLPRGLPFLSFDGHMQAGTGNPRGVVRGAEPPYGHWKLGAIDACAGDRPTAWIDDAFNEACRAWARERPAPTLLVETTPDEGLVERHAEQLLAWARTTGS